MSRTLTFITTLVAAGLFACASDPPVETAAPVAAHDPATAEGDSGEASAAATLPVPHVTRVVDPDLLLEGDDAPGAGKPGASAQALSPRAAPPPPATPGTWARLAGPGGAALEGKPEVCSWGPGRLDVFIRFHGALYHDWYDAGAGWGTWESLGGALTSDPACASWGPGRLDVYARGAANDLQHLTYDAWAGGWSAWESLGGVITSAPNASSSEGGRVDIAALGTDGAVWHNTDLPWKKTASWERVGGTTPTFGGRTPAIALGLQGSSADGNRTPVALAVTPAGAPQWAFHNITWSPYAGLGGTLTGGIDAAYGANGFRVVGRGTDGAVWLQDASIKTYDDFWKTRFQSVTTRFSGWRSLGGFVTSDPSLAVYATPGGGPAWSVVFARGTDGAAWYTFTLAPDGDPVTYHGGTVMTSPPTIYLIWYGDWSGNSATTVLADWARGIGGSAHYGINSLYTDGSGRHVPNAATYGGSIFVGYPFGKTIWDPTIYFVVSNAILGGRLPADSNAVYFVLTSADVSESRYAGASDGFCSAYCGWHTQFPILFRNIRFSFVGNADRCPSSCAAQAISPNGNAGADAMASVLTHELEETVTDPDGGGWKNASGAENGDVCAWTFGPTLAAPNGSRYNTTFGGRSWLIQQNYDLDSGGYCAMQL